MATEEDGSKLPQAFCVAMEPGNMENTDPSYVAYRRLLLCRKALSGRMQRQVFMLFNFKTSYTSSFYV